MKNNIFEGAKFGDKFLTRDGRIAIYFGIDDDRHIVICEDNPQYTYRYSNGRCFEEFLIRKGDIISKYYRVVDEEIDT